MEIELPPPGTRGVEVPAFIRPILKAMMGTGNVMFRRGWKVQGRPLLRLTTIGARTGQPRQTILGWFPDEAPGDSWLVVGSNAGSARHPAWAYNLASNPDSTTVDLGEGDVPATAQMLSGTERDEAWRRVVAMAPGYGRYTTKTDREMPIFRLSARQT